MGIFAARLLLAGLLVLTYIVWSWGPAGAPAASDIALFAVAAVFVSLLFARPRRFPRITPKKIAWSIAYTVYLFLSIIKANIDVASRVVRPTIPLNPGIVTIRTGLKSPLGRIILANSITLTPGTLSVEIKDDVLYIHWIDVSSTDREEATAAIAAGFERYLEVIFG